ncbi:unnamed protein product [Gongylonema pulchrum]|uniref:Telomere_reg-2 domain-containing protein n=1 Tax=Gongylonema pulchrum TaxID=637853 RepID=A0A183DWI9_9BILA|nr:unnamed protein product [Gongylonema pulchrum]
MEAEGLIPQLYRWAESDSTNFSLRAYSFGLLAAALEVSNVAGGLRAENSSLIPIALQQLRILLGQMEREVETARAVGSGAVVVHEPETEEEETGDEDGPFAGMPSESFHTGERPSLADVSVKCKVFVLKSKIGPGFYG